jgi:hypothetical protein
VKLSAICVRHLQISKVEVLHESDFDAVGILHDCVVCL